MGGALEAATRQYFDFVDRKDAEAIIEAGTEDIQAVDEISRRWMRGIDELGAYIRHVVTWSRTFTRRSATSRKPCWETSGF